MSDEKPEVVDKRVTVKDRYPTIVMFIILTEFCERFSYSGMRAFLTLYLRSKLGYSDDGATETYHVFSTFVYLFPIVGGIVADNYLGKYRVCTLLGLFMITIGTGGIKPCVTAFGGDQFRLPEQEKHLAVYFSILYFNICAGSLIAKTISPILRSEVHCFGEKDCYSLAFGAPGLIILMSVVIFVSAKRRYVIKEPEGNVVMEFVKCVSLGIKNAVSCRGRREKRGHWLNTTEHKFEKRFVADIKKTMSVLTLFSVLPVFWSLLDQMGSRWTLQATKMDGRLGCITIKPDQMQVLNPIVILITIPLAQKYIYPYLERRNILKNPLHKLTLGGILAGLSFIVAGTVEIYISTTYPQLPAVGFSQLRVFNGNNCPLNIYSVPQNISNAIPPLSVYTKKDIKVKGVETINMRIEGTCIRGRNIEFMLQEKNANSVFVDGDDVHEFVDDVDKSRSGLPVIRFLTTKNVPKNITLIKGSTVEAHIRGISPQMEVFAGAYDLLASDSIIASNLEMLAGGVYALMADYDATGYKSNMVAITEPNSITMALLVPQFLLMSTAEVLFAVTGNEFAFKEAPDSMKAVMTASWLLTEAAGNILIIVITRIMSGYRQETQFFFYTCLIFVSMGVFHRLSKGYQLGHSWDEEPKKERRSNSEVLYLQVRQAEDCLDHL
ncbi:hypothetical protein ACJJTC_013326 [Scirpophaga incertulas]